MEVKPSSSLLWACVLPKAGPSPGEGIYGFSRQMIARQADLKAPWCEHWDSVRERWGLAWRWEPDRCVSSQEGRSSPGPQSSRADPAVREGAGPAPVLPCSGPPGTHLLAGYHVRFSDLSPARCFLSDRRPSPQTAFLSGRG